MIIFPNGKLKFLQFWHSIKTNNCINDNSNGQLARANGDILDNRAFDYDVNDDTTIPFGVLFLSKRSFKQF